MSEYQDVIVFHQRFGILVRATPQLLSAGETLGRAEKMLEELMEFMQAARNADLSAAADALVDLVYFAKGTAAQMGLPWEALWNEVQRANMAKIPQPSNVEGRRRDKLDVIKPPGWVPPRIAQILGTALMRDESVEP